MKKDKLITIVMIICIISFILFACIYLLTSDLKYFNMTFISGLIFLIGLQTKY